MKQTVLRILMILLSAILLLGAVSCGVEPPSEETTAAGDSSTVEQTEAETEIPAPDIEKKNYDCDFNIMYCDGIYDPNNYFPEENMAGAVLQDAAVERNVAVSEHLGVDFHLINAPDINLVNNLRASMQSGDDSYQMVMTHPYIYVDAMITEGMLLDLSEQPAMNIDAPYWNGQLMEQLSIKDKMFLGYSDYSLANTWLITFNKEIHKTYQMEDLYGLVDNKNWTLDKMISLASVVSEDNGDGKWTSADTYGFAGFCQLPMISFMIGSDIDLIREDENGIPYVSLAAEQKEKTIALAEKMRALYQAEYSFMWIVGATDSMSITDGRALFVMSPSSSLKSYLEYDVPLGILPYPLYDANQEQYRMLSWNGFLGIPSTVENADMSAEVLELLAYHSAPVKTAFFEILLGTQIAEAPEDARMLDLIWQTQSNDVGQVFATCSDSLGTLLYCMENFAQGQANYASFIEKHTRSAERAIQKMYEKIQ